VGERVAHGTGSDSHPLASLPTSRVRRGRCDNRRLVAIADDRSERRYEKTLTHSQGTPSRCAPSCRTCSTPSRRSFRRHQRRTRLLRRRSRSCPGSRGTVGRKKRLVRVEVKDGGEGEREMKTRKWKEGRVRLKENQGVTDRPHPHDPTHVPNEARARIQKKTEGKVPQPCACVGRRCAWRPRRTVDGAHRRA
jgi:hypothetical protein